MSQQNSAPLDGIAATIAALRTPPPRNLSPDQARNVLTDDAEHLAARGAAEAAALVSTYARTLPAPPAGGWTTTALADLLDPGTGTGPAPQDGPTIGTVVTLADERARRAAPVTSNDVPGNEDDEDGPAPVDGRVIYHPTATAHPWDAPTPHRDVLPLWLRDASTARAAATWAARHTGHVCAFHTVRVPLYWSRLAVQAPRGTWRITCAVTRWTFDAEAANIRRALAAAADRTSYDLADATTFVRLEEQRRSLVRQRGLITGIGAALLAVALLVLVLVLPTWQLAALVIVALALLGLVGRDVSAPVVSRSVDTEAAPKLTSDLILTALGSLGIGELNKHLRASADGVRFPSPITRDGAGWRSEIDLPPGVTAGDVAERRDRLASGLRRPLGCVWPETAHDVHTGRLVLWVADKPMNKTKPPVWPLASKGTVNLFHPFPIGVDPRGRIITTELMFTSCIVGAMPRMGKTFSVRVVVLGAALDPRTELHLYDLKGGADWMPLEPIAHAFRIGDDPEDVAYLVHDLRAVAEDMTRRYKTLRGLSREVCPEGKITDALASDARLGLHPVVLSLDECQRAFEHPDHGKEITALCEDLAKRGPAAGIIPIYSTQRPDSSSLPKSIASNAAWRLCLKVAGQVENDMVLGTSAYQNGTRATMFARGDKGVGYLAGEGDEPVIVRLAYLDATAAEKVAARARAARIAAGRLTGHAAGAGLDHIDEAENVLDHLVSVWPAGQPRAWCETLAERLAETYPTAYATWKAEDVTAAVKPHGLATRQIKRDGVNRRGLDIAEVTAARDAQHPEDRPAAG